MTLSEDLKSLLLTIGLRLLAAAVVFIVGRWLIGYGQRWLRKALDRVKLQPSMETLLERAFYFAAWLLVVLTILAVLGVPVTVLVAVTGLVIIVVGIALKESLGDIAAAVIFMMFQPFRVGEVIQTNGITGEVKEIQVLNCVLQQADGKLAILPNSKVRNNEIINLSRLGILRVDMVFGIGYRDDIEQAKRILSEVVTADARVLTSPPPDVFVQGLADSAVLIAVRAFTALADYFFLSRDIYERAKLRFDQEGISIPFPQRAVHLIPVSATALPMNSSDSPSAA